MKKIVLVGLIAFLILSGMALAGQPKEQAKRSSKGHAMGMMGAGAMMGPGSMGMGMEGMGGMMGMMGQMIKMMDHGSAMMESMHTESGQTKEGQKK